MGRFAFFVVHLGQVLLKGVSASRLLFQPFPTNKPGGGAFAASRPIPTLPPEHFASTELAKRDRYHMGHDTCGFGALDSGITYTCYSSIGTCENIGNFRGCCTGEIKTCSSTFWTKCDDYDPTSFCGMSSKTRCCQSALPYCITWRFSTTGSIVTAWDCDTQSKTRIFDLLATPLSLIDNTPSPPSNDLTTTSSSQESTNLPSAKTTGSATPPSTSSSATSVPSNNNSSTPIGAIIGGVLGGFAVIGLTILGIFFIKKYQKGARITAPSPTTLPGPQELPGFGIQSTHPPPLREKHAPVLQYDDVGRQKYQAPVMQTVPVFEAPDTPATGTGSNRTELG